MIGSRSWTLGRAVGTVMLLLMAPLPVHGQRWTLDETMRAQIDETFSFIGRDAPGCAVGVVQDGQLAYAKGYGLANLDWGIPITASTVFDIGSVSKQFTAAALALLDIEGVLSLDDLVQEWIPELPAYEKPVTIRHLLNHTSGVRDYLTLMRLANIDYANVFDEFDGVEMITRQQALNFDPGSEYLYSNSGYLLLANIVRRATGQSLREFLEERVFDPLGMAHTSIWDLNTEIVPERAMGYSGGDGDWRINHAWNFQMGGDGQVITSVEDLVRWDANFYDPTVGRQPFLDRMHTRGILNSGDTIRYALGLNVGEYKGVRRVQHGGSWAGFRAQLARYPDQHTTVVVLCNRSDANLGGRANLIADIVLADELEEPVAEAGGAEAEAGRSSDAEQTVEPPSLPMEGYAGRYRSSEIDVVYDIRAEDGGLSRHLDGESAPLTHVSGDVFAIGGIRLTFHTDGDSADSFAVDAGRVTGIVFERESM